MPDLIDVVIKFICLIIPNNMRNLLLIVFLCCTTSFYAQVGVGTTSPNPKSALDIESKTAGVLIPRLTQTEIDALEVSASEDGLTVYNVSEDCFNFWNKLESRWKSLCGDTSNAKLSFDCSKVKAEGSYIESQELNETNYLTIPVTVTKSGTYAITVTTTNGYNFYTEGKFVAPGTYTIKVPGQGTPITGGINPLSFIVNGVAVTCTPAVTVTVTSRGTFTFNCGSASANGSYLKNVPLAASNTLTIPVTVAAAGVYSIRTTTVNGFSFSGKGTFAGTGAQSITLQGTGTPLVSGNFTFTVTSDYTSNSGSCSVAVTVAYSSKRVLTIGDSKNVYGYNFSGTAASNKLITTTSNYGITSSSIIKYQGSTIIDGTNTPTETEIRNWLIDNPVDIVIIGFSWGMNATEAGYFAQYLNNGGVVLAFIENDPANQLLLRAVFNNNSITVSGINAAGAVYKLSGTSDEILNGPFGNITNTQWGEDASVTSGALGLPTGLIDIYSNGSDISGNTTNATLVTAFKHKTLNFMWIGDGGFNSNNSPTSTTITPFILNTANYPVLKANYGRGTTKYSVYNSILTANAFAWAIKRADAK